MKLIADALDAYAASSTKKFSDDRLSTLGASEVGQCARKMYWRKADGTEYGVEQDEDFTDTWGARQRGTVFEDRFWVPAMRAKYGSRLKYAGRYQKTFVHNYLSATPDGLLTQLTAEERDAVGLDRDIPAAFNCALVECKTIDPRATLTEPKQHHVYQTQVQMGLVRLCTSWQPERAIISYVDASFWSDVKEFVVTFDQGLFDLAIARAETVLTERDVRKIAPEGWIGGGYECRTCPYLKPCGIERRNLPYADLDKPVDPQFAAEIADMARELKAYEVSRDVSDIKLREMQHAIKDRLRDKGLRKVPGVVTWSAVKGRAGYDNKAVLAAAKEAGVDISKFETQGEASDRLAILIGADTQP